MPSRRHDERPGAKPADAIAPRAGDRIAKLLARAGIASRREIERMIAEGRVALDGVTLDTPATVLSSLGGVTVDGNPVAAPEPARLFLYHKPPGLLVTERDPRGRPTIYDRLPGDLPRVVPVGRLDVATEGLLLLTTDGGFKRQLELPATGVERSYRARAYGTVHQSQLEDLMHGVEVEGVRYGSINANIERRTGANVWIEMTLAEGKNREVRRVLEHLGLQVSRLIRTRYGPFVLGDLPPGEVGEVKQHELVAFRRTLKGGSPDEPIGLPVTEAPRAGFRTAPSTDRSERSRRPAAPTRAHAAPRSAGPRGKEPGNAAATQPSAQGSAQASRAERALEPSRPGFRVPRTTDRAERSRRPEASSTDRDSPPARGARGAARGSTPGGPGERAARAGQAARPQNSARPERSTKAERPARVERPARTDRPARPDRENKPARPATSPRTTGPTRAGSRPGGSAKPGSRKPRKPGR